MRIAFRMEDFLPVPGLLSHSCQHIEFTWYYLRYFKAVKSEESNPGTVRKPGTVRI